MTQKLTKCFMFNEKIRPRLTFSNSDKIRLNPDTNRLELREQGIETATGKTLYPLDTDLYVQIAATNPKALVQWIGFGASPHVTAQPDNTNVAYRLNDGTSTYYWDGGSWSAPGASDWSSEQDVAANIDTFPASSKTISLLINLSTTDKYVTPYLESIDLLMLCDISYFRSLIGESLIPALRNGIAPIVNLGMNAPGGTKISLKDLETPFEISQVLAVYDHEADPGHQISLYSSYDATSKIITLSSSVARGTNLWVDIQIELYTYLSWGDQDYIEVEKIPAIVITSISPSGNTVIASQEVKNISTNQATVRRNPFRLRLEIDVSLLGEGNRTLLEMWDKALAYFASNATLHWEDLDEYITMFMLNEGDFRPRPNLKNEHTANFSMVLADVYLWMKPEEVVPLIQQVNLTLSSPELQGGVRYTDAK